MVGRAKSKLWKWYIKNEIMANTFNDLQVTPLKPNSQKQLLVCRNKAKTYTFGVPVRATSGVPGSPGRQHVESRTSSWPIIGWIWVGHSTLLAYLTAGLVQNVMILKTMIHKSITNTYTDQITNMSNLSCCPAEIFDDFMLRIPACLSSNWASKQHIDRPFPWLGLNLCHLCKFSKVPQTKWQYSSDYVHLGSHLL